MPEAVDWSFVIPVYNEQDSLRELHDQIVAAVGPLKGTYEIIFVNDGSKDGSWDTIRSLADEDPKVRAIGFRRNFGKASALSAGFAKAGGKVVFTLDADLQDDPAEIPNFLAKLAEGYDVVSGWKKIRHDPWHKVLPSRVFNAMVSRTTGVKLHDHNCGFKVYRREVLSSVAMYGERHRFVPVLAAAAGFRVGEVVIKHRARPFGKSKYGWNRFLRGYLDLQSVAFLTKYRHRPMHFLGARALLAWGCGFGLLLFGLLTFLWAPGMAMVIPFSAGMVLLIFGMILYVAGLLAEHALDRHAPAKPYTVSETIRCD